jgi:hypothetical protein
MVLADFDDNDENYVDKMAEAVRPQCSEELEGEFLEGDSVPFQFDTNGKVKFFITEN